MKKILLSLIATLVVLLVATTSVNAASLSVPSQVKEGDIVTVTVNFNDPIRALEINLKYDITKFDYQSVNLGGLGEGKANEIEAGVLRVVKLGLEGATTSSVTFTFKAKSNVTGSGEFSVVDGTLITDTDKEIPAAKSIEITAPVIEPSETDPTDPTPTDPAGSENNGKGKDTDSDEKYIDDNGNEITEITQAGNTYFVGVAIALVALVSGALVVRKIRK